MLEAEEGLLKSTDGGRIGTPPGTGRAVWNRVSGRWNRSHELIDPVRGHGQFRSITIGSNFSGLMKSTDGGESWVELGLNESAVTVLGINPVDPRILYASTEDLQVEPGVSSASSKVRIAGQAGFRSTMAWKASLTTAPASMPS